MLASEDGSRDVAAVGELGGGVWDEDDSGCGGGADAEPLLVADSIFKGETDNGSEASLEAQTSCLGSDIRLAVSRRVLVSSVESSCNMSRLNNKPAAS